MADDGGALETLLMELGVDTTPLQKAAEGIKSLFQDISRSLDPALDKVKQAASDQKGLMDQVKQKAADAVDTAKQALETDSRKNTVLKEQTEELKKQGAIKAEHIDVSKQQTAEDLARKSILSSIGEMLTKHGSLLGEQTVHLKAQTEELKKQHAILQEHEKKSEGQSFGGKIAGAIFGSTVGKIAGGVAVGEVAKEGILGFLEHLKEATIESGKLVAAMDMFDKSAQSAGVDGSKFMEKLADATDGLVGKLQLAEFGSRVLNSGMKKMVPETISAMIKAAISLGSSQGLEAPEVMEMMKHMMQMPSRAPRVLAQLTGMNPAAFWLPRQQFEMPEEYNQRQMENTANILIQKAKELGDVPDTLEKSIHRVRVAVQEMYEEFGHGFNESSGGKVFMTMLNQSATDLDKFSDKIRAMGEVAGGVLATLAQAFNTVKTAISGQIEIVSEATSAFKKLFDAGGENQSTTALEKLALMVNAVTGAVEIFDLTVESLIRLIPRLKDLLPKGTTPEAKAAWSAVGYMMGGGGVVDLAFGGTKTASDEAKEYQSNLPKADQFKHKRLPPNVLKPGQTYLASGYTEPTTGFGGSYPASTATPDVEEGIGQSWIDLALKQAKRQDDLRRSFQESAKSASTVNVTPQEPPNIGEENALNAAKARLAEAQAAYQKQIDSNRIAASRAEQEAQLKDIAERQEAEEQSYRNGEKTLKEHLDKMRDLENESYRVRSENLAKDRAAQLDKNAQSIKAEEAKYDEELNRPNADPAVREANLEIIRVNLKTIRDARQSILSSSNAQEQDLERGHQRTLSGFTAQGIQGDIALRREAIQTKLQDQEAYVQRMQELNQKAFQIGDMAPDAYFKSEEDLYKQSLNAKLQAAIDTFNTAGGDLRKKEEDLERSVNQAYNEYNTKAATLSQNYPQTLQQYTQRYVAPRQGALTSQLAMQQNTPNTNPSEIRATIQQLADMAAKEVAMYQAELPLVKEQSDEWYQIQEHINQAYQTQVKYTLELQKMQSMLNPIAQGFKTIGESIVENFHSKFAQNLGQIVGKAMQPFTDPQALADQIMGRQPKTGTSAQDQIATTFKGIADEIKSPFGELAQISSNLADTLSSLADAAQKAASSLQESNPETPMGSGGEYPAGTETTLPSQSIDFGQLSAATPSGPTKTVSDTISKWATQLEGAAKAVDGFTESILGAKNKVSGAIGGAQSGGGVGQTISGLLGASGPLGKIAGSIGGGLLGMITGGKEQQVTNNINNFMEDYQNIMLQFQTNTNNLQNTIIQITDLVAQIEEMQASSKKGGSQYQSLITQYNQQILQLKAQQDQVIVQMNEQVAQLVQPMGMQSYLSSLTQILQTYQQFAGAATSVDQLTQAQNYLTESMANYEYNLSSQLLQDNTQAIQDALQLNDLLFQRQTFINQLNSQIQGIMGQGDLTRQLTFAQSKAQQVYQVEYGAQQQLDQMNEEIALQQYKVQAESQVFNIASTRIALETQLLALQEAQTDRSMQQITQLQALVNQLMQGNTSSVLAAITGAFPTVTNPSVDMGSLLDSMVGALYASRGALGYGAYSGVNLQ